MYVADTAVASNRVKSCQRRHRSRFKDYQFLMQTEIT